VSALVLILALLLQGTPVSRIVSVRTVELDVRLDPATRTLAGKASLELDSRRVLPIDTLALVLPPPFADRTRVEDVWDETGLLAWTAKMESETLLLRLTFARPLAPLARRTVVIRFQLSLDELDSTAVRLSQHEARLESSGWYPLPKEPVLERFRRIRLGVRLPRTWRVEAAGRLKRVRTGLEFAEYEITAKNVAPQTLLFQAQPE